MEHTQVAATKEKQATLVLIDHLLEVERRGLHFTQGYASIWEYVYKALKYSESSASERVNAMRLIKNSPEARTMIERQELSLTVASKLQQFVKAVKKTERRDLDTSVLLAQVSGKSKREAEKIFAELSPLAAMPLERMREVSETHSELRIVIDREFLDLLAQAKTLYGSANQTEALKRALRDALAKQRKLSTGLNTPNFTRPDEGKATRYIPVELERKIWTRAQSRCEFVGTKRRCTSTHRLQIEKIDPGPVQKGSDARKRRSEAVRRTLNVRRNGEQVADEADEPFSTGPCANHNLAEARRLGLKPHAAVVLGSPPGPPSPLGSTCPMMMV
jgi:hypothetical protein